MQPEGRTTTGLGIAFDAPPAVAAELNRIGRTEDLRFSPGNTRLAVARYAASSILVADVAVDTTGGRPRIAVSAAIEITSPRILSPHGVDFLDDETIVVASRRGDLTLHRIPPVGSGDPAVARTALEPAPGSRFEPLDGPSNLWITHLDDGDVEVLVCNRYSFTVTRHVLRVERDRTVTVSANEVLLHRWLRIPDGVAVSPDGVWMAVSTRPNVLLYERSSLHDGSTGPVGVLRGAVSAHGLCFAADGRHLFVADAGSPFLHVYEADDDGWRGVGYPARSVCVVAPDVFARGHINPHEGGVKGLAIDRRGDVLASTTELVPLAFHEVGAVLGHESEGEEPTPGPVDYELGMLEAVLAADTQQEERMAAVLGSRSYRVTAPLRRLSGTVARIRRQGLRTVGRRG